MNKLLPVAIAIIIVGGIAVYAISPYFTESTIDEALPPGAIIQPKSDDAMMEDEMKDDDMMEDEMKDDDMMEDETKDDDMMEDETKDDAMMEDETKDDDMMEDETKDDDMMEDETKDDDMMEDETKDDDMMEDETKDDDMMEDETKDDAMMEDETKDDAMMEDETTNDADETTTEDTMADETTNDADETTTEDTMADETVSDTSSESQMTLMSYAGTFIGANDGIHNAEGIAYTIPLEDGSNVLRLEDFRSTNGPDLYVYLSVDSRASEFLNLGTLKANQGNQNYAIPEGADLSEYNKVLVWCKAFGVLFGSAELLPQ